MAQYIDNYLLIMKALSSGEKPAKLKDFYGEELNRVKQDLSDFDSLVNYDSFMFFVTDRFSKDVAVKQLFYDKMYVKQTADFNWIVQKKQLSELENKRFIAEQQKLANGADVKKIYWNANDRIKLYNQLLPYQGEIINNCSVDKLQDILEINGAVKEGNNVYFSNQQTGENFTCKIGENQLTILGYNERQNPFKTANFRVFDKNGEVFDIKDEQYTTMLRSIRKKTSRNYENFSYLADKPFGGRIVQLNRDKKVVLFSNNWQQMLCNVDCSLHGRNISFKTVIVPQINQPIQTDDQCAKLINDIKIVEIDSQEKHEVEFLKSMIEQSMADYYALVDNPVTLEEFLQSRLKKYIGDAPVYVTTPEQTKFLKARLIGNQNFYNISKNTGENMLTQRKFVESLATKFYSNALSRDALSYGGQLLPLTIDLSACVKLLKDDLRYIESSREGLNRQHFCGPNNIEKQVGLAAFVAYKNLMHNQFISDLLLSSDKNKKYLDTHNQRVWENLQCLTDVDMSMVETYNNRVGQKNVETTSEKRKFLSAIRHAIGRNEVKVLFGSDFGASSSKLVFYDIKEKPYMVAIDNFINLMQHPLFVNHKPENCGQLEAQTEEELLKFVQNLCQNMSKSSASEWGE